MVEDRLTKNDLETVLKQTLGTVEIEEYKTVPLTEPGENYGSIMLSVEVTLSPDHRMLPLVAKLVPPNKVLQEMFDTGVTVRKEIDMYLLVSPAFNSIQKEYGLGPDKFLELFPVCYGARATKGEDLGQNADEDAIILLENLRTSGGYKCEDRFQGYTLRQTEFILEKLARFHAIPVAIRVKKPDVFRKTVLKACVDRGRGGNVGEDINKAWDEYVDSFSNIPQCGEYTERVRTVSSKYKIPENREQSRKEPFVSLSHGDFWTNNIMLRHEEKGSERIPTDIKIIDFQCTTYESCVSDLVFFLFTSLRPGLVVDHLDRFLRLYFQNFAECLSDLGCDVDGVTWDEFVRELNAVAPMNVENILFMLRVVKLRKDSAPSLETFNINDIFSSSTSGFGEEFYTSLRETLKVFGERKWI